MNRSKIYITILTLLIFLAVIQSYFSNKLTNEGKKFNEVQRNIAILEEENNNLKNNMASLGCLNNLMLIAKKKGFVKDIAIVSLSGKTPIALKSK